MNKCIHCCMPTIGDNLICEDCRDDEDYGDRDWHEEEEEREYEERAEMASSCTCGAWQFNKKGDVVHIADCICGAG